ncbi:MAG: hypothetical protein ACK535_14560 [Cyanobacteriota bacterium]
MVPAQSTSKDLSQRGRKDLAAALHRVAVVLIGIYIIMFINAVLPPNINDPRWATGILDSLRSFAFLPLIGGILILLANHMDRRSPIINKHRNWVRKFAPLAALGFFLLIPLQGMASYNVNRMAKIQAAQNTSKLTRAITMIRSAQDETELRSGIAEAGIQNLPQAKPMMPTEKVKEQIIAQIAPEVSKLQNQSDRLLQMASHDLIIQWLRDSAIALAYGFGFPGLSIRGGVVATIPFGVKHKIHTRPWKQDDQNPMAP